jgi:hypothetical protein
VGVVFWAGRLIRDVDRRGFLSESNRARGVRTGVSLEGADMLDAGASW